MLYMVILCYIMLYYVILCYIMLYYVILCYIMLYYVILCYIDCIGHVAYFCIGSVGYIGVFGAFPATVTPSLSRLVQGGIHHHSGHLSASTDVLRHFLGHFRLQTAFRPFRQFRLLSQSDCLRCLSQIWEKHLRHSSALSPRWNVLNATLIL